MNSEQCQAVGDYQGCQFFCSYDRSKIEEAEALNNIVEEDLEDEVMMKVTHRVKQLLGSTDYASLTDKQKILTRT